MTDTLDHARKTKRAHRSPHGHGFYVNDRELIELLGVPADVMAATLRSFDANPSSGFPKKQPLFGNRRYLPAVKAYLDKLNGIKSASPGGEKNDRKSARD